MSNVAAQWAVQLYSPEFQSSFRNRVINGETSYSSLVLLQVGASLLIISSYVTFMDFYPCQITYRNCSRGGKARLKVYLQILPLDISHIHSSCLVCVLCPSALQSQGHKSLSDNWNDGTVYTHVLLSLSEWANILQPSLPAWIHSYSLKTKQQLCSLSAWDLHTLNK